MTKHRSFTALVLAAILAACGQPAAPAGKAAPQGETDAVILGSTQNMPDWLFVARQRDCQVNDAGERECGLGEIHFNQRTITRSADGTADIWIQVRHAHPQAYESETETMRTTIRYQTQRMHYRFNCNDEQFVVVERQFMGANDTVVARDEPRQIYRDPVGGSVTQIIMPIACRGA